MSGELKTVWSHSRTYAVGMILNRAAGLILVPVYTRLLTAEEFGLYAMVTMLTDLLGILFRDGLTSGMVCVYFDYQDERDRSRVVSTTIRAFGAAGIAACILAYPLGGLSSHFLFGTQDHRVIFTLAYAGMVFTLLFDMGLNYIRMLQRSRLYLLVSLVKAILFLSFNVYLVAFMGMGVKGIMVGTLISGFLVSSVLVVAILRKVGLSYSREMFRKVRKFGVPLIFSSFLEAATGSADKYFLNRFVSIAAVGYYSLGNRIASVLHMFVTAPFGQIWSVRRLETLGDGTENREFGGIFTYFVVVLVTTGLGFALLAPEVVSVVASRSFSPAASVVPIMILSYVVIALSMNFQITIYHAKKTKMLVLISVVCAIACVVLNFSLVRRLGMAGAALSVLLTNVVRTGLMAWVSARSSPIRIGFEWRRIARIVLLAMMFFGVGLVLLGQSVTIPGGIAKIGLVGLFLWSILLTGTISAGEAREMLLLVRRRREPGPVTITAE